MEREFFPEFYFGNINGEAIRAGKKLQLNNPQFSDLNFTTPKQNTTKGDATPREENPMAFNFSYLPRSTNSIDVPFNDANLGNDIGESSISMDSLGLQEKERIFFEKEHGKTNRRKGREASEMDSQSKEGEDGENGSDGRKPNQRATSSRRSRTAEMHNLSERRRRDKINEKLKALQELLPHCNKTDKASMLDEAIEYLKSLQIQLQMMWIESGMAPMIFPETHQCMSITAMDHHHHHHHHHHDHHHDANSLQHPRITRPLFDDQSKLKDLNANQPVNSISGQTEDLFLHKFSTQETNEGGFGARTVQEMHFGDGFGIDRSSFL